MHVSPEETGVVGMAVEQLFYAVEDSPDRRFLMQVLIKELMFIAILFTIYLGCLYGDIQRDSDRPAE